MRILSWAEATGGVDSRACGAAVMDRTYATTVTPATLRAARCRLIPTIHAFWATHEGAVRTEFSGFHAFRRRIDTKNPSVPVRRGVISQPSGDWSAEAPKTPALSPSAEALCSGGTTENP